MYLVVCRGGSPTGRKTRLLAWDRWNMPFFFFLSVQRGGGQQKAMCALWLELRLVGLRDPPFFPAVHMPPRLSPSSSLFLSPHAYLFYACLHFVSFGCGGAY